MFKKDIIYTSKFPRDFLFQFVLLLATISIISVFRHGSFWIPVLVFIYGFSTIFQDKSYLIKSELRQLLKTPIVYSAFSILGLGLASSLWSVLPMQTLMLSFQFIGIMVFITGLFALENHYNKNPDFLLTPLFIAFLLASLFLLAESFELIRLREILNLSYRVIKPNVELLSLFLIPIVTFTYQRRWKFLSVLVFLLTLFTCYKADIRASYYGLILGCLSLPFWYYRPKISKHIASIGITLYMISLPMFAYFFDYTQYISFFMKSDGCSFLHRLAIWKFTAQKTLEKFFFGWGAMSSKNFPEKCDIIFNDGQIVWNSMPAHPHNIFMQVWLELGLVGTFFLLAFLLSVIRYISRITVSNQRAALGFLLTSTIPMLSLSHSLWHSWWIIWIAFTAFLIKIQKTRSELI